jgi:excisionase family DNA binding protein
MTSSLPPLTRESVLDGRAVGELLHLPASTVLEYARRGVLPGHKLGRRWIFIRDELDAAVRAAPAGSQQAARTRGARQRRAHGDEAGRDVQLTLPVGSKT